MATAGRTQLKNRLYQYRFKIERINRHPIKENAMRGQLISQEYNKMEWIRDENGKEYACYLDDVKDKNHLTEEEKKRCLDVSQILGDSW